MPEIITKYPDVTRQVLESAGARCGTTSGAGTLADLGGAVGLPALALAVVVATWRRRRPVP